MSAAPEASVLETAEARAGYLLSSLLLIGVEIDHALEHLLGRPDLARASLLRIRRHVAAAEFGVKAGIERRREEFAAFHAGKAAP